MAITINPMPAALGAEIVGIDASKPLDAATAATLSKALDEHIVLILRDQALTLEQQVDFAENFGPVLERPRPAALRPEGEDFHPGIMMITNKRDNKGEPLGSLPDGEMYFHHDTSYIEAPHKATFLFAIEIPSVGGNTKFANMYRAYETLPSDLKAELAGKSALNIYSYELIKKVDGWADIESYQHFFHPVFITHPGTHRKALYVSRLMTARIEGFARAESDALLERLFAHTENPDNIYEHVWRPGDLAIWDNLSSIHARTDFPDHETRLLRRCTIEGVRPYEDLTNAA